ncbi:hypothetical protein GUITHDRAFT_112094 [Guillardia theta CCMP2712]|uniref:5'-nucleotidase n=1 Tax=Guillardia theta (strain CCMP2712) TaxID=905079 RepID=L1J0X4_GUITC|nr:hypothetical protein GUITHDRAFT_112094 [Guillardia theta CCMP2712]EKX41962.1 hypothetical protein GUITHDRAFT_112094 [Guillardia theta CCMP2712]|eukprot:XP_005828942.1 hypothetical protein GUITHDRAFT_112094 [Guillardia theta CCMP2712]
MQILDSLGLHKTSTWPTLLLACVAGVSAYQTIPRFPGAALSRGPACGYRSAHQLTPLRGFSTESRRVGPNLSKRCMQSVRGRTGVAMMQTNDKTETDRRLQSEDENSLENAKFQSYQGEIFCNRALNMKRIRAIGFDMDYTLAQYIPETFEILAIHGALEKLVKHMGYPEEILSLPEYDPSMFQRGLIIDKERGNIIKMDRHHYVKVAFHGMRAMEKEERLAVYGSQSQKDFSDSENFANIDTLFSLPDAFMYSQLVTFVDDNRNKFPGLLSKSYKQIYKDVRRSVDLCHRDGVIKDKVAQDPGKYIQSEPGIVDMLRRYRRSGRKVFLLTNSLWDYTNVVMNFICGNMKKEDYTLDWLSMFDLVIVGANKFGGNFNHLHYFMKDTVNAGEQVMYVGDHMFSDVIRGKRSLGWRTALVVPELQHEVDVMLREKVRSKRIQELRELRDELDEWVDRLSLLLVSCDEDEACALTDRRESIASELEKAKEEIRTVKTVYAEELLMYHSAFHPVWGQMFKPDASRSLTGWQLEETPIRRILRARARNIVESLGSSE